MPLLTRFLVLLLLTLPVSAAAATLTLVPPPAPVGTEFSIDVLFSPEGEAVNAVEGAIEIPAGLEVLRVSTGGSTLTLWPVPPSFSRASRSVSFAGGVVGTGLPAEGASLLFTLHLKADAPATYRFTPLLVSANRADGTGARIAVAAPTTSVVVDAAGSPKAESRDWQAPATLVTVLGADPSLFDGAAFVSFYGSDAGSGIVAYEAKEGWFGRYQPVDRYYLLRDAGAAKPVWIRAVDAQGNARSVHVPGTGDVLFYAGMMLPLLLLIGALLLWRVRERRS